LFQWELLGLTFPVMDVANFFGFYLRDTMLVWVYAMEFPSVCVSVCLSVWHKRALCQNG